MADVLRNELTDVVSINFCLMKQEGPKSVGAVNMDREGVWKGFKGRISERTVIAVDNHVPIFVNIDDLKLRITEPRRRLVRGFVKHELVRQRPVHGVITGRWPSVANQ
jgi:hypothetical protein